MTNFFGVQTSNTALTITAANKEPRFAIATDVITSAGGSHYLSVNPSEFLSLGVYKNGVAVEVAVSNDVDAIGDITALNYKVDPDHDSTSVLDYLKGDTRGLTAAKITRVADSDSSDVEIRAMNYKDAK